MELISAKNNRRCNDSSTSFSFSQSFNIACTLQYTFLRVIDVRCHTDVKCSLDLVSNKNHKNEGGDFVFVNFTTVFCKINKLQDGLSVLRNCEDRSSGVF